MKGWGDQGAQIWDRRDALPPEKKFFPFFSFLVHPTLESDAQ
jgi:hypothetical protein